MKPAQYSVLNDTKHIHTPTVILYVKIRNALKFYKQSDLAVWLSGNALVSINEVTLRRARLVLGWVTVSGVQLPVRKKSISVYNQPPRSTQPGHLSVGRCNEYQPRAVMLCGWGVKAGMVHEWVASKTMRSPCYHGSYLSALAMGSSHNTALYKSSVTLTLTPVAFLAIKSLKYGHL